VIAVIGIDIAKNSFHVVGDLHRATRCTRATRTPKNNFAYSIVAVRRFNTLQRAIRTKNSARSKSTAFDASMSIPNARSQAALSLGAGATRTKTVTPNITPVSIPKYSGRQPCQCALWNHCLIARMSSSKRPRHLPKYFFAPIM
jgi:hypothetical protein